MNLGCIQGLTTCMGNCFRWLSPTERAKARKKETDAMLYDLMGGDERAEELKNKSRPAWSLPSTQIELNTPKYDQQKLSEIYELRERIAQEVLPQAAQQTATSISIRKVSIINTQPYENPDITEV